MAISRYTFSRRIPQGVSSSSASFIIFNATASGALDSKTIIMEEGKRLDQLSGEAYGDAGYWWVIAAASGIGWGMQVPPGTIINIPLSLEKVIGLLI